MNANRRCSRPGCPNRAVATLTYVYADSTVIVGTLSSSTDPHSWDLCAAHAPRITAPRGWELVRHPDIRSAGDESDLTALLDAVTGDPAAPLRIGTMLVDTDRPRHPGETGPAAVAEVVPSPSRPHLRIVSGAATPSGD